MIDVHIHEKELPFRNFVFEDGPGAHARTGCIPGSLSDCIDVFGKPEKTVIQQFEALFFPENRVVLPFRFTVFQTDADRSVFGQAFLQVGHLVGENFLCSENVDVVKSDHVCGEITSVGPLVRTVRLGIDADVERHYFEFVVGRSGGGRGEPRGYYRCTEYEIANHRLVF